MQPPVPGENWFAISSEALSVGAVYDWVLRPHCGAVVLFSGTVRDGYRSHGRAAETRAGIEAREVIDYARYRELHEREVPVDGGEHELPRVTRAPFRLAGYSGHRRLY